MSKTNGSSASGGVLCSGVGGLVGRSAAMVRVRERVAALARLSVPVLVRGEEGSGRSHVVGVLRELRGEAPARRPWTLRTRRPPPAGAARRATAASCSTRWRRSRAVEQARWRDALLGAGARAAPRSTPRRREDLALLARRGGFDPVLAERARALRDRAAAAARRRDDLPELGADAGAARLRAAAAASRVALVARRAAPAPGAELARQRARAGRPRSSGWWPSRRDRASSAATSRRSSRIRRAASSRRAARARADSARSCQRLIDETGGNLAEVARRLEMSRGGVIYRAQKFGLMRRPLNARVARSAATQRRCAQILEPRALLARRVEVRRVEPALEGRCAAPATPSRGSSTRRCRGCGP